jgi:hypothetical protein
MGQLSSVNVRCAETATWVALAILVAAALAPTLMVAIPGMVDYPNHLARMYVLATAGTPDQSPYYRVAWGLYPNLAMDLIVPQLARPLGVEAATKAFFLFSQALVVSGAMAIEWIVKGRHRIAGFAALLTLHGLPFAMGFVNFEFGVGVALWGIASWLAVQEKPCPTRLGVHSLFVLLLFMTHFFALGIYGLTIGCCELWRIRSRPFNARGAVAAAVLMAGPVLLLLAIMVLSGGAVGGHRNEWYFDEKVRWLLLAANGYDSRLSAASVATVALLLYVLRIKGLLSFSAPAGKYIAAGFVAVFLALPFRLLDTSFADVRIVTVAAFVLPAFITIDIPNARAACALIAAVGTIILANAAVVACVWLGYDADYAAFKRSFAMIERGSRVLVGHSGTAPDPPDDLTEYPAYHAPTLAVHYAQALVPTLFTYPGKQPVEVAPAFRHLAIAQGGPAPIALLKLLPNGHVDAGAPGFLRNWHRDFDYLYLLGPRIANPMPGLLDEVANANRFILYRIRKPT